MDLFKEAAAFPLLLDDRGRSATYRQLLGAGASREELRTAQGRGRLGRVARGSYVVGQPGQVIDRLTAVLRLMPPRAAFGFGTAALLHGFGVVDIDRPHVVVPRGDPIPQIKGVAAHEAVLPFEPMELFGLRCVPPDRCALDLVRTQRRIDALPVLDAALFSGACSPESLAAEAPRHCGLRGVRQARELLPLADPRPDCRQESQLRLLLHDAGLPAPTPQFVVSDDTGYGRCVLDLAFERERVGVEYDGSSHLNRPRLRTDRARHNWLEMRGWTMRYATDGDVYGSPLAFTSNLRSTLLARRFRTP